MIDVPYLSLSPEALNNLIVDVVSCTDDNGFDASLKSKVDQIKSQLRDGTAIITYDEELGSCYIRKK